MLRTPQNNKEEGARAKKLVTCGTRGPLGRDWERTGGYASMSSVMHEPFAGYVQS